MGDKQYIISTDIFFPNREFEEIHDAQYSIQFTLGGSTSHRTPAVANKTNFAHSMSFVLENQPQLTIDISLLSISKNERNSRLIPKKKKIETKEEVIGTSIRFTLNQINQFQTRNVKKKKNQDINQKKRLVKWLKTYKIPIFNAEKVEIGKLRLHLIPVRQKSKISGNLAEIDVLQYWRDKILKPLTEKEIEDLRISSQRSKDIISEASLRLSGSIPLPNSKVSIGDGDSSSEDDNFTESYSYDCESNNVNVFEPKAPNDEYDEYSTDGYLEQEEALDNSNNNKSQNAIEIVNNTLVQSSKRSHFNESFQNLVQKYREIDSQYYHEFNFNTHIQPSQDLYNVVKDFMYCAETYGKIIISERFLDHKTIQPIDNLGGIAGGSKYIVHDILFKFAIDNKNLYGSDDAAAKVASCELYGANCYMDINMPDLCIPLMAIVDYRGLRLLAMNLIPIMNRSLIYGSSNAGLAVFNSDPKFSDIMEKAADELCIEPHVCGRNPATAIVLHSCCDIEGHQGTDGRYYLVDFSRTCPAESPDTSQKNSHLYRLLRQEVLREFKKATRQKVSNDAFSAFQKLDPNHTQLNHIAKRASAFLYEVAIPNAAAHAYRQFITLKPSTSRLSIPKSHHSSNDNNNHSGSNNDTKRSPNLTDLKAISDFPIEDIMHSYGVNMRHSDKMLNSIISYNPNSPFIPIFSLSSSPSSTMTSPSPSLSDDEIATIASQFNSFSETLKDDIRGVCALIIADMIARTIKVELRRNLRDVMELTQLPADHPFILKMCETMNLIFYDQKKSEEYWATSLLPLLEKKYATKLPFLSLLYPTFFSQPNLPPDVTAVCFKKFIHRYDLPSFEGVTVNIIIFKKVEKMMGFKFSKRFKSNLISDPKHFIRLLQISPLDFKVLGCVVKHLHFSYEVIANLHLNKAISMVQIMPNEAKEHLKVAESAILRSLSGNSMNAKSHFILAQICRYFSILHYADDDDDHYLYHSYTIKAINNFETAISLKAVPKYRLEYSALLNSYCSGIYAEYQMLKGLMGGGKYNNSALIEYEKRLRTSNFTAEADKIAQRRKIITDNLLKSNK